MVRTPVTGSERVVFDGPAGWPCAIDHERAPDAEHGFLLCDIAGGHLVQTMTTCMTSYDDCAWSTMRIGDNVKTAHLLALACATPGERSCGGTSIVENLLHYVPLEPGAVVTPAAPYFAWAIEHGSTTKTMSGARDPIVLTVDDWVCQFTVDPQPQATAVYEHLELGRVTCTRAHAFVETSVVCAEKRDTSYCGATALRFGADGEPWDSLLMTCKSPRGCVRAQHVSQ